MVEYRCEVFGFLPLNKLFDKKSPISQNFNFSNTNPMVNF